MVNFRTLRRSDWLGSGWPVKEAMRSQLWRKISWAGKVVFFYLCVPFLGLQAVAGNFLPEVKEATCSPLWRTHFPGPGKLILFFLFVRSLFEALSYCRKLIPRGNVAVRVAEVTEATCSQLWRKIFPSPGKLFFNCVAELPPLLAAGP
ncbi:unnamed protein product [Durusdinium trenchii]|uniref:Uncharacterized protein n=1 Tax=Durusdinium trenchii TaxID=1381693 RepID=A0ABP0S6E0_9DINO